MILARLPQSADLYVSRLSMILRRHADIHVRSAKALYIAKAWRQILFLSSNLSPRALLFIFTACKIDLDSMPWAISSLQCVQKIISSQVPVVRYCWVITALLIHGVLTTSAQSSSLPCLRNLQVFASMVWRDFLCLCQSVIPNVLNVSLRGC